jgi:hypothetical protein
MSEDRSPLSVAEVDLAIALGTTIEWFDSRLACWRLGRIEKAIQGRVYVMPQAKAETTRCVSATKVRSRPGRPRIERRPR